VAELNLQKRSDLRITISVESRLLLSGDMQDQRSGDNQCDYGQSAHYRGSEGERYFAWQHTGGEIGGRIEARYFQKWIQSTDRVVDFGCAEVSC
jgi:hypothetical protein